MKISTVKYIAYTFLFSFIWLNAIGQASKTAIFHEYDNARSFKGIKFGTIITQADAILKLEPYSGNAYSTTNSNYKVFNDIRFQTVVAYFNRDNRMYQVSLMKSKQTIGEYLRLKSSLRGLFGKNDAEYYIDDKTVMNMTWEGNNMSMYINYDPASGSMGLTIQDKKTPDTLPVFKDHTAVPRI